MLIMLHNALSYVLSELTALVKVYHVMCAFDMPINLFAYLMLALLIHLEHA